MTNSDQPAFPEPYLNHPDLALSLKGGITKREYFAAMAMQGMLANPELFKTLNPETANGDIYALAAIEEADKLLKQLEK